MEREPINNGESTVEVPDNKETAAGENREISPRTEKEFLEERLRQDKEELARLGQKIESIKAELGFEGLECANFELELAAERRHGITLEEKRSTKDGERRLSGDGGYYKNPTDLFGSHGLLENRIVWSTGKLRSLEEALNLDVEKYKNNSAYSISDQELEKYQETRRHDFELFEPTLQEVVVPNVNVVESYRQAENKLLPFLQEKAHVAQEIESHELRLRKISEEQGEKKSAT